MKTVMVFGTFDILHAGHEDFFRQARALGEKVIAVVARDRTVKQVKGRLPLHEESIRARHLKASGAADTVVLGDLRNKYAVIKRFHPHVIALGYDQFAFTFGLEKFLIDKKLDSEIVRLRPYKPNLFKSSLIRAKVGV